MSNFSQRAFVRSLTEKPDRERVEVKEQNTRSLQQSLSLVRQKGEAVIKPILQKLTDKLVYSTAFERIAKRAFKRADIDNSGKVSALELRVAIYFVYEQINIYSPSHVPAPTREQVLELMKKHDINKDGELDIDEFMLIFRSLFGMTSMRHSVVLHVLVVILGRLLILPLVAYILVALMSFAGTLFSPLLLFAYIPIGIYVVVLELVIRFFWGWSVDAEASK